MWVLTTLSGCLLDPDAWRARRKELLCAGTTIDADEDGARALVVDRLPAACASPGPADCDDADPAVHPGAAEGPADGVDSDCDGTELCLADADGDGFGGTTFVVGGVACDAPGEASAPGDCDDGSAALSPGATEVLCNGIDDDCAPATPDVGGEVAGDGVDGDCDGFEQCYEDGDGDGFGGGAVVLSADFACVVEGLTSVAGDCDDANAELHPAQVEHCNRIDDNCDGLVDDDDPLVDPDDLTEVIPDRDGDGYGHRTELVLGCFGPPGDNRLDCDDDDPLATIDQDWYVDTDGDLAGAGPSQAFQCTNPGSGLVPGANGDDCEPDDPAVFPLQVEDCVDGADQNCDGLPDCQDPGCATDVACLPACADEAWFPLALPATVVDTTLAAGNDHVAACGGNVGQDYAFWFTPPISGTVTFDTQGTPYDTVLFVRDACGGVPLGCNDDEPTYYNVWSQVAVPVTAGVPVLVVVDGFSNIDRGPFTLHAR